jgi:predicted DNA-binding protein YlxM (UPF0122 family)
MIAQIVAQGKQKGIKRDAACLQHYDSRLKTLIKATIARDLYDDKGFYCIYSTIDDDIIKAIQYANSRNGQRPY